MEDKKIPVQISFIGTADLEKVERQLIKIRDENPEFEFWCGFVPKDLLISKGKDTKVVDLLDSIVQMNYITKEVLLDEDYTFEGHCNNIKLLREKLADKVNRMFVLDAEKSDGVKEEIMLFTQRKVLFIYD